MALINSKDAIGAISSALSTQLQSSTDAVTIDIGRPEQAASPASSNGPKFSLFLYQISIDNHLRNFPLDEGQKTPLWLVLHYVLTAFDESRESDSALAHNLLGDGMLALQQMNYFEPLNDALTDNPEPLKISFDNADSDLLSKIMQGSDEKYRVSTAFQVRPVMIAPSEPPLYSLPVTTIGPPANPGVVVLPGIGPLLERIEPEKFIAGDTINLFGTDIGSQTTEIRLGNTAFAPTMGKLGHIRTLIDPDTLISAGSYPITAFRPLPANKGLISNAVFARLLPTVTDISASALVGNAIAVAGTLTIQGNNLGNQNDDIYIAFYRNGAVEYLFQGDVDTEQRTLTLSIALTDDVQPGIYYIIVRVNGEQTPDVHEVNWTT